MSSPERALANLQAQLPGVRPLLYNLADQLLDAAPEAQWNVLISDDTSARLPGYFVRSVLSHAGYSFPTHFVAGSKAVQERLGAAPYKQRFDAIARHIGAPALRPLLFTESVGSGETIDFLRENLAEFSDTIETATVVNRIPCNGNITYAGGEGPAAAKIVFYTFENSRNATSSGRVLSSVLEHTPKAVKQLFPMSFRRAVNNTPANSFIGLYNDPGAELPIASRAIGYTTAHFGYHAMRTFAAEYAAQRVIRLPEQTAVPDSEQFSAPLKLVNDLSDLHS